MTASTLDPRLYGVIYITGAYGVGKTTLATTAENPKKTAILDFDLKFKAEAEGLGFWYRSPDFVTDIFNANLEAMAAWLKTAMMEIPEGTTTVVFDNASQLEALLAYIVGKEPEKYGVNATNARTGAYGGVNPGVGKLWKNIVLFLQKRGVRVIFIVAHLGQPWMDGKPVVNKFRGKGSKILQELANLSLILTRDNRPEPAGIVLKEQFARRHYTPENGWTIQRVFPLRFPKAAWKSILGYFDTPANFEAPAEGETPSKTEMDMFGELFTKQQIEFMKAVVNGTYTEDGDAVPVATTPEPEQGEEHKPPTPAPQPCKAKSPIWADTDEKRATAAKKFHTSNKLKAAGVTLDVFFKAMGVPPDDHEWTALAGYPSFTDALAECKKRMEAANLATAAPEPESGNTILPELTEEEIPY